MPIAFDAGRDEGMVSLMVRSTHAFAAVLLLCGFVVVVTACPRPLSVASEGPARVAPDAVAVLRLPTLERAERAAQAYLQGTRGAGERSELEALLRFATRGKVTGSSVLGLAKKRSLLVSWRPSGEMLVWLPVDDAALFDVALDRLLEARGAVRDDDLLASVRVYREPDGRASMLARVTDGGALLWPEPLDAFSAASLLDALATGRLQGRWPTGDVPPSSTAAADMVASGAGLSLLAPSLTSVFGGPSAVKAARAELNVDGDTLLLDVKLALHDDARARVAHQVLDASAPPEGFCELEPNAIALARAPVALLSSEGDDGPLDELRGQLAIAIVPSDGRAQPGWIVLGRPRGLSGRDELLGSVRAAGVVERRTEQRGERTVRVFAQESAAEESALLVIADEDLFALSYNAAEPLARLTSEASSCDDGAGASSLLYLLLKPRELSLALAKPSSNSAAPLGAMDAMAALQRLTGRLPDGFSRLEASASLADDGVAFSARATLGAKRD